MWVWDPDPSTRSDHATSPSAARHGCPQAIYPPPDSSGRGELAVDHLRPPRAQTPSSRRALYILLVFASIHRIQAAGTVEVHQESALSQQTALCGASKKTRANCIQVLTDATTTADVATSALWMPRSEIKERNVISVKGNGVDPPHGSAIIWLPHLHGLPDEGREVVWLYDGDAARKRWKKEPNGENYARGCHKAGILCCAGTVPPAWCEMPDELVTRHWLQHGRVPTCGTGGQWYGLFILPEIRNGFREVHMRAFLSGIPQRLAAIEADLADNVLHVRHIPRTSSWGEQSPAEMMTAAGLAVDSYRWSVPFEAATSAGEAACDEADEHTRCPEQQCEWRPARAYSSRAF